MSIKRAYRASDAVGQATGLRASSLPYGLLTEKSHKQAIVKIIATTSYLTTTWTMRNQRKSRVGPHYIVITMSARTIRLRRQYSAFQALLVHDSISLVSLNWCPSLLSLALPRDSVEIIR
jgi:hypothetical protein